VRSGVPLEARVVALREHGGFAVAYSATFQPGLEHFGDERGFVAYRRLAGVAHVLAEPIASADCREELITRFIAEKREVCWWQISRPLAELLAARGFLVNRIGVESRIQLSNYTFAGPARRNFRRALRKSRERGDTIAETSLTAANPRDLAEVSDSWRQTRATRSREMGFLVRPAVLADEPGVRKFLAFDRGRRLAGFAVFDPVFQGGATVGYLCSANRTRPDAHPLLGYALFARAIETFKAEGKPYLFIGLSPAKIGRPEEFAHSWQVRGALALFYRSGWFNRHVYSVKGLCEYKAALGGTEEPTYCAYNRRPGLAHLLSLGRACNVIGMRGYSPAVTASARWLFTQSPNVTP
jgi:lysylphosphatidylglycerol synthetase-like protein (DUF2156 family)